MQRGDRVNLRSKEAPEGEKQEIRDSSNKTDCRKFHTFPQGNTSMFLIQKSQVWHTYHYPQGRCRRTTDCIQDVVKLDTGNATVSQQLGVNSVLQKPMQQKPVGGIQSL